VFAEAPRPEAARGPEALRPGRALDLLRQEVFGQILTKVIRDLFLALDPLDPHHPPHASAGSSSGEFPLRQERPFLKHVEMPEAVLMDFRDGQVLPGVSGTSKALRERYEPPGDRF
jgi:hypothetical protein